MAVAAGGRKGLQQIRAEGRKGGESKENYAATRSTPET